MQSQTVFATRVLARRIRRFRDQRKAFAIRRAVQLVMRAGAVSFSRLGCVEAHLDDAVYARDHGAMPVEGVNDALACVERLGGRGAS